MMDPPCEYTSSDKNKWLRRCDRLEETQDGLGRLSEGEAQQWENRGSLRKSSANDTVLMFTSQPELLHYGYVRC